MKIPHWCFSRKNSLINFRCFFGWTTKYRHTKVIGLIVSLNCILSYLCSVKNCIFFTLSEMHFYFYMERVELGNTQITVILDDHIQLNIFVSFQDSYFQFVFMLTISNSICHGGFHFEGTQTLTLHTQESAMSDHCWWIICWHRVNLLHQKTLSSILQVDSLEIYCSYMFMRCNLIQ